MSPKDIKEKMKFIKDNMIFDIFTNLKYRKNLGNILLTVNYVAVVFRKNQQRSDTHTFQSTSSYREVRI